MRASTGRKTRKRQPLKRPTFEGVAGPADPTEPNPPIRQQILEACIPLTVTQRNNAYGDPLVNLGLAGNLKVIARAYAPGRHISYSEWEALDLLLTKVARIITGGIVHRDNYIDAANYCAIAGELAEREEAFREQVEQRIDSRR